MPAIYTVTNCSGSASDVGSLPWAINQIQSDEAIIEFSIPDTVPDSTGEAYPGKVTVGGDTWYRIITNDTLTIDYNNVQIRGSTQAINQGDTNSKGPEIEIRYADSSVPSIFEIGSSGVTIEGLALSRVGANGGDGIYLNNKSNNCHVYGCYFGLSATGETSAPNKFYRNIDIIFTSGHLIGGEDASYRNVISNATYGIMVNNSSSCEIYNNFIGTDMTGNVAFKNSYYGVYLVGPSSFDNKIGDKGKGNLISGNTNAYGIYLDSFPSSNVIAGNIIGLNSEQTAKLENGTGVALSSAGENNSIGKMAEEDVLDTANYISGNNTGIYILNTNRTKIYHNVIGTNASFESGFGNLGDGIWVTGASEYTQIGSPDSGYKMSNLIVGNRNQILLSGSNVKNTQIFSNFIGIVSGNPARGLGGSEDGIYVDGAVDSVIGTSEINGGNFIGSMELSGIHLDSDATNNKIFNNVIGMGPNGEPLGNKLAGIRIESGSYNQIGSYPSGGNYISNNGWGSSTFGGIGIASGCSVNTIEGNIIGKNLNSETAAPNVDGIRLLGDNNYVYKNKIVGNSGDGVYIDGSGNVVLGNEIGISSGSAMGNTYSGISIGYKGGNIIGNGTLAGRNIISGNGYNGIEIFAANSNEVYGNFIGASEDGQNSVPNGENGIYIFGNSSYNKIGQDSTYYRNIIVGHNLDDYAGIYIFGGNTGTNSNEVVGNYIGVGIDGTTSLPNYMGVYIYAPTSNNAVNNIVSRNIIAKNNTYGIYSLALAGWDGNKNNKFSQNSIFDNVAQGIRLDNANDDIGVVDIKTALVDRDYSTMQITGEGARANALVEVFISDATGQGEIYLGSTEADASGKFDQTIAISQVLPENAFIVATQTDTNNNTSIFSNKCPVSFFPYTYQPDAAIGLLESGADYIGVGVVEHEPVTQIKTQTVATNETVVFYFKVINAGQTSEAFTIQLGSAESSAFTVKYFYPKDSTNEVTSDITKEGGETTPFEISVGGSLEIRGEISYNGTSAATTSILGISTSSNDATKYDVVKAVAVFNPIPSVDHFAIFAPSSAYAGQTFVATISAYNASGTKVSNVSGTTYLSVDDGLITPESVDSSLFVNGDATINMQLSKVGQRLVRVTNSGATGEAYIVVGNATQEYVDPSIPGLKIEVPMGATTTEITLSASIVSDPSSGSRPAGFDIAGQVYELGPSGTKFLVPVIVTIPISGGPLADPKVYYWDGTKWSNDGITFISQTSDSLTFSTTHFTSFAPFTALPSNLVRFAPNPFNPNNGTGRFWYWLSADKDTSIYLIDLAGTIVFKRSFTAGANGGKNGENNIEYDGKTSWGDTLGNGVYLYKIVQDGKSIGGGKIAVIK